MANLILPLFSALLLAATITKCEAYYTTVKSTYPEPEKLTHLHFYFHDIVSGNNPTSVVIVKGSNSSATAFGMVAIADDRLTEGPVITSEEEEIGRGQGIFASADQKNFGFLMNFNFVFTKGEFAGSSIAMYGRNPIFSVVRDMSIVGGTGAFRFGRGYAEARTFMANNKADAVVEYNVFIWH